jgi:NADPH:quinone reductase-like Zn-dependent oxidoreductase
MRAVLFQAAGKPKDVLRFSMDIPVPSPRLGEVLVQVDARPIQPADIMFIEGRYRIKPQYPQIAGLEGTGIVVGLGAGVSIKTGTRVAFRYPATWAEYVAVPADHVYVVPDGAPIESAAQFALNPVTAWALLDETGAQPGDWIAINAATSSVAHLVRNLAVRRSIGVIGIVRAGSSVETRFPAIPADTPNLAAKILGATGGVPITGYLDSVGGMLINNILPALGAGATIVSYGVLEQVPAPILNSEMIYRNLCWKGFGIDHWLSVSKNLRPAMADQLWTAILDGGLPLPVRSKYSLEKYAVAITDARQTGAQGKVLIVACAL